MNDIIYNIKYAAECVATNKSKQDVIDNLQKEISDNKNVIKDIVNIPDVKRFIADKLQEAIDKYDLNKGKDDNEYNITICSSCSSDGDIISKEMKMPNSNSKFNPYKDDWDIVEIITDNNKIKIKVDNIKGRKHMFGYYYEPDYYETDWFE